MATKLTDLYVVYVFRKGCERPEDFYARFTRKPTVKEAVKYIGIDYSKKEGDRIEIERFEEPPTITLPD